MSLQKPDPKLTGVYAGLLSLVEIGLGSVLHAFHVPFSGTFLSLNQTSFLTRVVKLNRETVGARTLAYRVSTITALLKSLSPAGKKLLPMLAISAQGCFFSLGTLILGPSLLGCLLGSALSSCWGILQPIAVNALVFGSALGKDKILAALNFFKLDFDDLFFVVALALFFKAAVAMILSFISYRISSNEQVLIHQTLLRVGTRGFSKRKEIADNQSTVWKKAFKELLRPFFLIPLALTAVFLFFSESSKTALVWSLLRVVTTGYLFFLIVRLFPMAEWIKQRGFGGTALAAAIEFLEEQKSDD